MTTRQTDTATVIGHGSTVHCGPVSDGMDRDRYRVDTTRHDGRQTTTWTATMDDGHAVMVAGGIVSAAMVDTWTDRPVSTMARTRRTG